MIREIDFEVFKATDGISILLDKGICKDDIIMHYDEMIEAFTGERVERETLLRLYADKY